LTSADFVSLEALRGIAALYVVTNHSRGWLWAGGKAVGMGAGVVVNQVTRLGHEAVIVFFVLSGFSIAHSVSRSASAFTFWWRRLLRLYPPMVAALAWAIVAVVVSRRLAPDFFDGTFEVKPFAALGRDDFLSVGAIASNLLYIPTGAVVPQFWSLPHEMVFYLMAPLLFVRPKVFYAFALGGWLLALVVHAQGFWAEYALHYLAFFALGAVAYARIDDLRSQAPRGRYAILAVAMAFFAMIALSVRSEMSRPGELLAAGVALVAIPSMLDARSLPPILQWLGRQSYTLYLTHVATILLVLAVLHRSGLAVPVRSPWLWPVAIPPVLVVSTFLYLAVETRTRVLLERGRRS
jgi:peptidoglycan/LPS O-acetylase OafA/YrhL